MDHKWLEDFLVLARERNFSKAATPQVPAMAEFPKLKDYNMDVWFVWPGQVARTHGRAAKQRAW